MQTYSHFLITAIGQTQLKRRGLAVSTTAILVGSVLPDIPFAILTAVFMAYYTWFAPLPVTNQSVMEYLHFDLYFNDPLWIASHNFFHAPLILLALGILGWSVMRQQQQWGVLLFWFAVGAGLHSVIDIFTHHNDGPLLLFPLNWQLRFLSPVSYWHPDHYGLIFAPLEHLLDVVLATYLVVFWLRRRRMRLV
ncbi:MAG: metal-dependent hydrolase [Anaerolineae bacterium]|nr:metal-dependent hydrolase [Anaerolineae bacterium]